MGLLNKLFPQQKCSCQAKAVDLARAKSRSQLKVECLCGEEGICDRLREMGFCESSVIEKVAQSGSLICKVCDTKVILSKELAQKILVKDICPCHHGLSAHKPPVLSQLKVGQMARIKKITLDGAERLEEMGLTPGEIIELVRFAPLGDPIEIRVRGYMLSIRRTEADHIEIDPA